jgi:undecaprenyl-diphosphatase
MNTLIIFCAKYLIVLPVLVLFIYWLRSSTLNKRKIIILSFIALPLAYVLAKIGSHFYFNPRPFVVDYFIPLIPHANDNGFPSDHTLLAASISFVQYAFNKRLGALLLAVTIFIGSARVFAGVHHSIDIIGSILISAIVVLLTHALLNKFLKTY